MSSIYRYQAYTFPIQTVPAAAQTLSEWLPSTGRQYRLRPAQRDYTAATRISGFEAITIDQWHPHEPFQYRLRPPKRDLTADTRISGFEATSLDQWHALPWRQYRLRAANRDATAFLVQLVAAAEPSTPDQWTLYGPTQYRLRPPRRDNTSFTLLSGFEATSLDQWAPSIGRQYTLRVPNRHIQTLIFPGDIGTSPDQWLSRDRRIVPVAVRVHPSDTFTILLIPTTPATNIDEWAPSITRRIPRIPTQQRPITVAPVFLITEVTLPFSGIATFLYYRQRD